MRDIALPGTPNSNTGWLDHVAGTKGPDPYLAKLWLRTFQKPATIVL